MLKSRIPEIVVEIRMTVREGITEGAEAVADQARERLQGHRVTGRLEEAVHLATRREGVYVVAGGGGDPESDELPYRARDVFWGSMLEHGTSHSAPHPFLVPSLDANRDEIVDRVRHRLRRIQ